MYKVYVIYNSLVRKFYVGQTENLPRRIYEHYNYTFQGYTSRFKGEWMVVYTEPFSTRSEAIKREKQLKSFRGREFVKQFIPE